MQTADLLVVEFAYNDIAPIEWARQRSYEQLLRKSLALPSQPAVLLLNHYAWWQASAEGATEGAFHARIEHMLSTLASVGALLQRKTCCVVGGGTLCLRFSVRFWWCFLHNKLGGVLMSTHSSACLQYYDTPALSLRAAAWRLMHAGVEGFKVRPNAR
jgi:hypothetical protein